MCFQIRAQQVSEKHRWDTFDRWVWGIADLIESAGKGNLAAGSYLVFACWQGSLVLSDLCSLRSSVLPNIPPVMWERNGGEASKHNQIVITKE